MIKITPPPDSGRGRLELLTGRKKRSNTKPTQRSKKQEEVMLKPIQKQQKKIISRPSPIEKKA